ncbi:MAG: DUF302 domain-containing protein [Rhodospirillales bacterium]|nr:DUF302 domain-containing protein [Rhodospirillales bacterium]
MSDPTPRRPLLGAALLAAPLVAAPLAGAPLAGALAATPPRGRGFVTRRSRHTVAATIARFRAAVTQAGWIVFTEIDHAAAAAAVGLPLAPRTVVLFGNPRTGTPAMRAHPTLALDLPMRVLVWADGQGAVFLTRATGTHVARTVFAPHGIALGPKPVAAMEALFARLATAATA